MQNQRAVNLTNNRGALHSSHATFQDYLQTQLANWRSSSYHPYHHQRLYTHPFNMSTEQDHDNNAAWVRSHTGREEHGPLTSAWANVHLSHPQPEQSFAHASFFSDSMDYFPEEAALFIPSPAEPGPVSRAMEVVPTSFALQDVGKTDESTATRLLQTNVDAAQYAPVFGEDWRKASIDFPDEDEDVASPALTEASSHGPFTPNGYDGEFGLGEATMRQLSHDLSSSFGSMRNDPLEGMFKDVTVDSMSTFTPWETTRACCAAVTQTPMDIQYGPLSSNSLGGLPMLAACSIHKPTAIDEKPATTQGRFRDVDGLPTAATMPFPELGRRRPAKLVTIAPAATLPSTSRTERDRYLLDMRDRGFTYREIKDTGEFNEAESTLRGRVRVLTKTREERVRKPEWTDRDVRLLRRAIAHVNKQPSGNGNRRRRTGKLPWKEVSEYITRYGGSYCFAPATCAKKWEEVSRDE
jgi:hypothetical protein